MAGGSVSYASIVSAVTSLLAASVPAIVTVIDARAMQQGDIPAAQCPALVFSRHAEVGSAFTEESDQRTWWLDCSLWNYYPTVADSVDDWDGLIGDVQRMFRQNLELGGLADTSETHVIACGQRQQIQNDVWMPSGVAQIIRGTTISAQVWESVGW